jgi:hypothetical protein
VIVLLKINQRFLLCFIVSFLFSFSSTTVFAANEDVFMHQSTVIPDKQSVENVIVIGGDATIYGTVREAIVIFNGDLTVKKSAKIEGIILVIGGSIHQEPGAHVTDNVLSLAFDNATKNSLFIASVTLLGIWLVRIVCSLLLFILSPLTVYLMKHRIDPFVAYVYRSPIQLLTIGFIGSLLIIALSILLSITIIGIPFVILLLLLVLLFFIVGLAAISIRMGEWLPESTERPATIKAVTGAGLVIAGINLPLFGGILLLCQILISLGMMTVWIWEKISKKKQTAS